MGSGPLAVVALSAVDNSKHTDGPPELRIDLGHFNTAGGIELTKVRRLIRAADRPWSL
jgi:hypothetical protein